MTLARPAAPVELAADLEGKPIALVDVGRYHCHDFNYPQIHCFESERDASAEIQANLTVTAVDYVRIYENVLFGGATMAVSQDYSVLAWIGWNDRISSFKALNSESGKFYVDWFYGGSQYAFCCNQQVSSLGSYNDTFSSVKRD